MSEPSVMPIRAALFDFDGTLADSFPAITASVNHVRTGYGLPPMTQAEVSGWVGFGLDRLMHDLCPGHLTDEAVARYREHHATVAIAGTKLLPGVFDTLTELHRRGVRLGVCSNKAVRFTRELVAALGVGDLFAAVLGPEDVGGKAKPDPAMLLEACRRLDVPPADAVYVGDMSVDVEAGHAAKVPVWLIPFGLVVPADSHAVAPTRTLSTFADILPLISSP